MTRLRLQDSLSTSSFSEPKLKTDSQKTNSQVMLTHTSAPTNTSCIHWHKHARAHITGRWRGAKITLWRIILGNSRTLQPSLFRAKRIWFVWVCVSLTWKYPSLRIQRFRCSYAPGLLYWLLLSCLVSFLSPCHPVFLNRTTSITS